MTGFGRLEGSYVFTIQLFSHIQLFDFYCDIKICFVRFLLRKGTNLIFNAKNFDFFRTVFKITGSIIVLCLIISLEVTNYTKLAILTKAEINLRNRKQKLHKIFSFFKLFYFQNISVLVFEFFFFNFYIYIFSQTYLQTVWIYSTTTPLHSAFGLPIDYFMLFMNLNS